MEFMDAKMQQGYGKIGFLGFQGSGKSYTAHLVAIGLHKMIKSQKPVTVIETETGIDWLLPLYKKENIAIQVAKTRAFADLIPLVKKSESISDINVIDSVSHFWQDLTQSFLKKQSEIRKRQVIRIAFQDWNILKPMWQEFTDKFLTSQLHFIICGRAGFEYDYFENEQGEMELYKTSTKMKVESEFGYEPSLLIEMERIRGQEQAKTKKGKGQAKSKIEIGSTTIHRAHIIKDRAQFKSLDGMTFDNPTFESFLPHFQALNIGGEHFVETKRDSQDLFQSSFEGKPNWKVEQEQKDISRAEIKAIIDKYFPSTSAKEKRAKIILKDHVFNVKSDEALDPLDLSTLKLGQEYLEWLLTDQDVIVALLEGNEEILKPKREEWHVFNAEHP